jgi:polysaccharide export outer membrane protein
MRCFTILVMAFGMVGSASAQQLTNSGSEGVAAPTFNEFSDLPLEKIGNDDLVGITVYDSPELTRAVRVGSDGDIRLPMLREHIKASGLYPAELEAAITKELVDDQVLVDPIVTVTVVEYRSRPITIAGAVKNPVTIQATGTVTLLDAISRAGGLSENAGAEILVSKASSSSSDKSATLVQRIPVRELLAGSDPTLNLHLEGGEDIRVPEAGRIFVLGKVKMPGSFFITDGDQSSVMKAVALSEGLDSFPSHKAYIYRVEGGASGRSEIPIDLKGIMDRKSPDVTLMANDILYIPDATGTRAGLKALETSVGIGAAVASALILVGH